MKANYLASPPLVVAYALAGTIDIDLTTEPLGTDADGKPVYPARHLADARRRSRTLEAAIDAARCSPSSYGNVFDGNPDVERDPGRRGRPLSPSRTTSTYIQEPPFFAGPDAGARSRSRDIAARACWPCSATRSPPTTSRPPATSPRRARPAATCIEHGVAKKDFNSYGARRGNDRVMMRGTFANIRLKNLLVAGRRGRRHGPPSRRGERMRHLRRGRCATRQEGTPLVVLAGKEYGTGSLARLGGQGHAAARRAAVIAESFERIHRSNLVGMGVLPLLFKPGQNAERSGSPASETLDDPRASPASSRRGRT